MKVEALVARVVVPIKRARPDLRYHGFGVKITALESSLVRSAFDTADSMAWSFAARQQGRDAHDWRNAARFVERIEGQEVRTRHFQPTLFY